MMKKIFLFFTLILFLFSCKKQERNAQLIKHCTGTYFLIDGEYHRVCNKDDFFNISNYSMMHIQYKFVKDKNCDPIIQNTCWETFEYSGKVIEVTVVE